MEQAEVSERIEMMKSWKRMKRSGKSERER